MPLELIDHISAPGDDARPNEDAWCASDRFAAAIDGATGLGEPLLDGASDAAWISRAAAGALMRHAGPLNGQALLRAALSDIEAEFLARRRRAPAETYELPMASAVMVEPESEDRLSVLWYGDCCLVLERPDGSTEVVGEVLSTRSEEAERAAKAAAALGRGPAGALRSPEVLAGLRAERNSRNQPGGSWTLAPDVLTAEHAHSAVVRAPTGSWLLLATDGFTALATDYGCYGLPNLLGVARDRGLARLLEETRAVERADPEGRLYPRFKVSDDATALLLRVTSPAST